MGPSTSDCYVFRTSLRPSPNYCGRGKIPFGFQELCWLNCLTPPYHPSTRGKLWVAASVMVPVFPF